MKNELIGAFWVSFAFSAALAFPIYRMLLALKSRQTIDPYAPESHQKKQGTPTMGGLIVLAGLIPGLIVTQTDLAMLVACITFGLIGFVDDFVVPKLMPGKRGLGWKQKILLQIGSAAWAASLSPVLNERWQVIAVATLTIVFFANAYNFADGLDGLAGGLLVIIAAGGFMLFYQFGFWGAMLGSILPFLFLNAPPAKVFMGDVGSLPIGALLGLSCAPWIIGSASANSIPIDWIGLATVALFHLVLVLELVLVPIQVAYFKATKKRLFPATPIHHGFEVRGWPESRVVWTFILSQAVCIMAAWGFLVYCVPWLRGTR